MDPSLVGTKNFVVIGAGAIGSFVVMTLSKMGAKNITVYDDDKIEDHNFANQMHPKEMMGELKVDSLRMVALSFGDCLIAPMQERWTKDNAHQGDIIISAVDNMDVRKELYEYYKDKCEFFIDGRMGGQLYKVYGVDTKNENAKKFYEQTLYPQGEAVPDRCGEKSIIYTVLGVSGAMLSQIKRYIQRDYRPTEVVYDCLNDEITKVFHMERTLCEPIDVPDEELINA